MNDERLKMYEIVGILGSDNIIRSGATALRHTLCMGNYRMLITRFVAEMVARFDLGQKWERLAEMPTLFLIDKDGNPCKIKEKEE